MTFKTIEDQLIHHEGERLKPYRCSAGMLTIGIGHNLENGISKAASRFIFNEDIKEATDWLIGFFGPHTWECFSEGRKRALIDLRFNLGSDRFMGFKRMITAIRQGKWDMAAYELLDSLWWRQVQESRRQLLYHQLKTGEC